MHVSQLGKLCYPITTNTNEKDVAYQAEIQYGEGPKLIKEQKQLESKIGLQPAQI